MNDVDVVLLAGIILPELPLILLPLVGLILARARLLPRGSTSLLATLGFALLLVQSVAQLMLQVYLMNHSASDVLAFLSAWSIGGRVLFLAALLCLSCAIFVGRTRVEP